MKPAALKLTEADVALACVQLLEYDGWRHLRTDPCSDRARGKGFGEKGMADALFIRYLNPMDPPAEEREKKRWAEVIWIEWKRPKGRILAHQRIWHKVERKRGALTWIAGLDFHPTFEDFKAFYAKSGLKRRRDAKTA